jgi:hypothetical protein
MVQAAGQTRESERVALAFSLRIFYGTAGTSCSGFPEAELTADDFGWPGLAAS